MASAFKWLDFAESDRQRAMQVIDLFRDKSTVDELGFAPIRDAFSDYFFPGTSTIQTRARYFLFVPWIVRRIAQRRLTAEKFAVEVRRLETELMKSLLAAGSRQEGIIGREALGKLKRMPSSVYWRGLHLWGIRLFQGSIEQYARQSSKSPIGGVATDDGEPLSKPRADWHPTLPNEPKDLFERAELELTSEEAEFLVERVCAAQPASLLARLASSAQGTIDADYAWEIPQELIANTELIDTIEHARRFSLTAWGGPLTYVAMVAELKKNDHLVAEAQEQLQIWTLRLGENASAIEAWDRDAFRTLVKRLNPRISSRTEDFTHRWIEVAFRALRGAKVWDEPDVHALVVKREAELKLGRARLRPDNHSARDRWQGDPRTGPMDLRWGAARTILNDVLRALHGAKKNGDSTDA